MGLSCIDGRVNTVTSLAVTVGSLVHGRNSWCRLRLWLLWLLCRCRGRSGLLGSRLWLLLRLLRHRTTAARRCIRLLTRRRRLTVNRCLATPLGHATARRGRRSGHFSGTARGGSVQIGTLRLPPTHSPTVCNLIRRQARGSSNVTHPFLGNVTFAKVVDGKKTTQQKNRDDTTHNDFALGRVDEIDNRVMAVIVVVID